MIEHPARVDLLARVTALYQAIDQALPGTQMPAAAPIGGPLVGADAVAAAGFLRTILALRRARDRLFDADLFADPAWDILLDLAAARLEGRTVSISSACLASLVAPTTALRHIALLEARGLILRTPDRSDGRRIHLSLTEGTFASMVAWLDRVQRVVADLAPAPSAPDRIADAPAPIIGDTAS